MSGAAAGVPIRRALLSVSDKRGLEELARALARHGVALLSTGGTARRLRDAGVAVTDVADHTGAPEMLDGRVKTLHPRIHAGLLARATPAHQAELSMHGIPCIDLVVVNLYPFRQTAARPGVTFAELVEDIDVGGPTMLRAAAKNHERVTVVVDPDDYPALVAELDAASGGVSAASRFRLAKKAFAYTAAYDAAIANTLGGLGDAPPAPDSKIAPDPLPPSLVLDWVAGARLRYGENPHQRAAFYRDPAPPPVPSVASADVLQGKELSYNNLLDLDAALALVTELERPAVAIIKHTNPCGVAQGEEPWAAYERARAADPVSAFGGIVAVNRPVDEALALRLADTFLECVIAPGFDEAARARLAGKKSLRLLAYRTPAADAGAPVRPSLRSVRGGLLVQEADAALVGAREGRVVSRRAPTAAELDALDFAWRVAKHVKSNAIVLARDDATVGIGAGQMSRVDSVRLAVEKAQSPVAGSVLASDAFFPFRDGVDAAAAAGVTAVIHPGGSVRDAEVIAAADEHGLAMVLTGMRHFRH